VARLADTWDAAQYRRFQAERDQPFGDLLDLVEQVERPLVVDLGCGDGRLTALAHRRLAAASTLGVDSSAAMLADAPTDVDGLRFEPGDIGTWEARATYDVVLANASLHWVPDHAAVLARWRAALRPGGQLAVQVPANADHASHVVLAEVVDELGLDVEPDPVAANTLSPERYAELLDALGATDQHVRLQVYAHHLGSSADVVEWVKGTTLTRVRRATDDAGYEQFLQRYRARLLDRIGERAPYTYLFKRILFRATFGSRPAR
jgi:trans-aconitate 2-methyltransferase